MDRRAWDVTAIVKKLKEGARASPWIPVGVAPRARYHHFKDGLSLCFTLDLLPEWYVNRLAQVMGTKPTEQLSEGGKFWHLSIARRGARGPTPEEVEFWRRAFFEEAPIIEVPGLIPAIKAKHFFWRAE